MIAVDLHVSYKTGKIPQPSLLALVMIVTMVVIDQGRGHHPMTKDGKDD
jgi:hypothetical protein